GNSKVSMKVSLWMNIVNVVGNAILIWGFHMEVAGAGTATLLSRMMAAIMVMMLLRKKDYIIHIKSDFKVRYEPKMVARILRIGIPNGLENSIFQLGKILVVGLIATYGEVGIAANSVANTISSFEVIPGSAIGLAMITVVGQCVGAMDLKQAMQYTKRLLKIAYIALLGLNIAVLLLLNPICELYHLSDQTAQLVRELTIYHSLCCIIIWPASFTLPNALRAANDVKFTMIVSISSMWIWRIAFSYVLAKACNLGVLGVWIAMTIDWAFRAICFTTRFLKGGWRKHATMQKA
ncbi:MAG: MATE family efflux transporter, partial [Lachnospiraceae bacterium]|nr:MATE family efflux transporter [Lachnospiraceae bacterium]